MYKISKDTLQEIACEDEFCKLVEFYPDKLEFTLMDGLKACGLKSAVWGLRCIPEKPRLLFCSDVAESVLDIFESKHPGDMRPRDRIKGIREYCRGEIGREALDSRATAAHDAYIDTNDNDAAHAAFAAYAAAYAAGYAAVATASAAAARDNKWDEIEQIFINHFGGGDETRKI